MYQLPNYKYKIPESAIAIKCTSRPSSSPFINHSFYININEMKKVIHENQKNWYKYKIYTNPYEFIHTAFNNNFTISRLNPVSRSFYKFIELNKDFNLLSQYNKKPINSLHIAEGPGGFIEALLYHRKSLLYEDDITGITLISSEYGVPNWKSLKDKLKYYNKPVHLEYFPKSNGDLYEPENFEYTYMTYKHSKHLVTADGGFDFSSDYENQESNILRLLFTQFMYAVICQKKGGTFIMKIFDIFQQGTIELLFFINSFYDKVTVVKPKTSRYANSEKYIVCEGFKYNYIKSYYKCFYNILVYLKRNNSMYLTRLLNINMSRIFVDRIQELNSIYGNIQMDVISKTIILFQQDNKEHVIDHYKKMHINKCIEWCKYYNIPHSYPEVYRTSTNNEHTNTRLKYAFNYTPIPSMKNVSSYNMKDNIRHNPKNKNNYKENEYSL